MSEHSSRQASDEGLIPIKNSVYVRIYKEHKIIHKKISQEVSTQNKQFSKEAQTTNKYKIWNIYKAHM